MTVERKPHVANWGIAMFLYHPFDGPTEYVFGHLVCPYV